MKSLMKIATLIAVLLAAAAAGAQQRPNVVIFLADDLGWNDVGYHGSVIQTPNLDRIAREGVRLERFYVYPVCSPTRAGLMTGRSSMRTGIIYSVVRPWENGALPLNERLMPQAFHDAGYFTAGVGKWHLGHSHPSHFPNRRGFDHYYGHVNGALDYFTHEREGAVDWMRNGKTVIEPGYTTELLGDEAAKLIRERDRSKPFFLYMPFNAPHTPLQAPEELIGKYAHVSDRRRRIFCAMVDSLDQNAGKVLKALEDEGIADDTLVMFFSDNGGPTNLGGNNDPLRGSKGTAFEGGIRVPALMRWPAGLPGGGRTVNQVLTVLDVFPTLAAAADVPLGETQPLDGKNMWEAIHGGRAAPREDLFFAVEQPEEIYLAALSQEWKLVRVIRKSDMSITNYLFQIEKDPSEKHNLAAAHPERVRELAARIEQWRKVHPRGGIRHTGAPHPGWVAPERWTAAAGTFE